MTEFLPMAATCAPTGTFLGWVGTIIFGAVIGMLARLVLPGKQNMGLLITILLGVLGAWIRWFISIAVAALLVVVYGSITGRKQV